MNAVDASTEPHATDNSARENAVIGPILWHYYPKALDNNLFPLLLQELGEKCASYVAMEKGAQKFLAKRVSCFFSDAKERELTGNSDSLTDAKITSPAVSAEAVKNALVQLMPTATIMAKSPQAITPYFSYQSLPGYSWSQSTLVAQLKQFLEQTLQVKFTYCLAHIYRSGTDTLGWHNDKEALDTIVVSVSFGQARKFRLRPLYATSGWAAEYYLGQGDIFVMLPGCQRMYKHCIPSQAAITEPRINLTFRQN